MPERALTPTRITLLELGDERRMLQEGYALLDEKRVLLATEILRGLRRYQVLRAAWLEELAAARNAMVDAVRRHGLEGVLPHPGRPGALGVVVLARHGLLGLKLADASLEPAPAGLEFPPAATSPEIEDCAARFAALAARATEMAALAASLRIMAADYVRTEHRARALENIVLPEVRSDMAWVESQLEAIDQEETLRVREARRRG